MRRVTLLVMLSVSLVIVAPIAASAGPAAARPAAHRSAGAKGASGGVTASSLGSFTPTFTGTAATGCSGCSLLSGPYPGGSLSSGTASVEHPAATHLGERDTSVQPFREMPSPLRPGTTPDPPPSVSVPPVVSCPDGPQSANAAGAGAGSKGPGGQSSARCDRIDTSSGGATGVNGIDAVDNASASTNPFGLDIEPADQGLCAGNGYVVETNNIGEILVFDTALKRESSVIPLDTLMGLTARGWSSGGDPSCAYDYSNGGHWFFTEIASSTPESSEGAFTGCFSGTVPDSCYEAIAVSVGSSPFGPYNVYFVNANYDPAEPGAPYLLNDFAKIATTRDAFLLFYDEFPLNGGAPGLGGGFFNGAQEFAFNKNALEDGLPVEEPGGAPNPAFTVAIENMGLIPTPDGTCTSDGIFHAPGITCWYQVIPAEPSDPSQYDNSNGGTGFMLGSLDFYGSGDNRLAVFDWSGLDNLDSPGCSSCAGGGIEFGGQLLSGLLPYYDASPFGAQKAGPIPLGDECGAAGLSLGAPPPASCPEGPIAANGDGVTQVAEAQGQLWTAVSTEVQQTYPRTSPELHQGALFFVIGTSGFDSGGNVSVTNQGYVSPAHEDIEFPAIAAPDSGKAVVTFTLSGNGGPTGADNGGFYPSTAWGRLSTNSNGLLGFVVHVGDLGQSPEDGFTEYQFYPGPTRPRWGDYSAATYDPGSGEIFFATNYIQYPSCSGAAFTLTIGTCGGTRDGFANWGTSVNSVRP